jgi:predicted dehydrogenase
MKGIGVIGAGSIGEYHVRALLSQPDLEVRGVCDANAARAEDLAKRHDIPFSTGRVADLLRRSDIDAVTVGVWNAAHAEVTIAALQAGKAVFCEKPMARTASEAIEMQRMAESTGRLLMIGFIRRFDLPAVAARDLINGGALGDIYHVRAGYVRRDGQPGGWFTSAEKAGGGALLDIGIHQLDLGLHLARLGPVQSVRGVTMQLPRIMEGVKGTVKYESKDTGSTRDVEDHAVATLYFKNNAVLALEASWAQHRDEDLKYLEIYGTKGGLVVDPELCLHTLSEKFLSDTSFNITDTADPLDGMFDREFRHFRDCLIDGVECLSPARDGVAIMKVIDAIYESARTGREVRIDS